MPRHYCYCHILYLQPLLWGWYGAASCYRQPTRPNHHKQFEVVNLWPTTITTFIWSRGTPSAVSWSALGMWSLSLSLSLSLTHTHTHTHTLYRPKGVKEVCQYSIVAYLHTFRQYVVCTVHRGCDRVQSGDITCVLDSTQHLFYNHGLENAR